MKIRKDPYWLTAQSFHFWPPIPHQILFEHTTPHCGWAPLPGYNDQWCMDRAGGSEPILNTDKSVIQNHIQITFFCNKNQIIVLMESQGKSLHLTTFAWDFALQVSDSQDLWSSREVIHHPCSRIKMTKLNSVNNQSVIMLANRLHCPWHFCHMPGSTSLDLCPTVSRRGHWYHNQSAQLEQCNRK